MRFKCVCEKKLCCFFSYLYAASHSSKRASIPVDYTSNDGYNNSILHGIVSPSTTSAMHFVRKILAVNEETTRIRILGRKYLHVKVFHRLTFLLPLLTLGTL